MPEATLTVRQLLDLPPGGFPTDVLRAGIPDGEVDTFRKEVTGALQGMPISGLETAICEKLSEALEIDPVNLLAEAWGKFSTLSDAAKQSKSGETVLVPLAEHTVKSELHPYVEIQVGVVKKRIEFTVTLSLKLKGVVVKVASEEIRGIEAGTCEGSAEVSIKEQSIWKHDIKPIPLPGKIKIGAGIRIR